MDVEAFRIYCLEKKGVTEELPFGPDALVFKVSGKMFALAALESDPFKVSLKCDPEKALVLRDEYPDHIEGAYHMNKKHWNSLETECLPPQLVKDLTDHSYSLVVSGLPKKLQQELKNL
ncbi:MmcQ/YjbR family DNA-binding protein [Salinimicrobium terrae]|uniref:MmcQ/YjbR family DNA-binding protein n=1 Tax=Salinimicrobium terrae TaxID=470866 RepID=UPI000417CDFC|nr:MmcQ/YjbR family DNA-binding protein [Salinimicrobium terrae]